MESSYFSDKSSPFIEYYISVHLEHQVTTALIFLTKSSPSEYIITFFIIYVLLRHVTAYIENVIMGLKIDISKML